MTTRQSAAIARYIRTLAGLMRLDDWTFALLDEEPQSDDHAAEIQIIFGRKQALISLSPLWPEWPPEELRHTLTHELIHCHVNDTISLVAMLAEEGLMTRAKHDGMMPGFRQAYEHAVDALADALAPHMPLPAIPRGRRAAQ